MKKLQKPFIVLLAVLLVAALSGCGSNNEESSDSATPTDEKVTLQYYTWTDEESYMSKIVEAFNNQNEQIEVKLNTISNDSDEYNTKIMNNLSGGSSMDVYSINGTASLGLYASKAQLVELSEQIKNSGLDVGAYGPSYQDIVNVLTEGKYYALPYRTTAWALFYNKTLFDQAGLEYPGQMTWDEYAELAKQLTKGEGADKQWGGYYADWIVAPLGALQTGSTILDDNLDEIGSFLQLLDRLYNQDQSHMSFKQMRAESIDWVKQFELGNVAMLINGEWTINMLNGDKANGNFDFEYDMAPLPLPEGVSDPTTVGGVSTFIGINPQSEHVDAAFEFVKFVAGSEGGSVIAESSVLPAYSSDETKESFLAATGTEGSKYFFEAKTVVENQPVAGIDEVNRVFGEQRDLYLYQEQDIETTISNFKEQRDSVLNP